MLHDQTTKTMKAKGSKGAWDEWMGIQLECQYEEDLTKQPEAASGGTEAAGGTTLWEMTTDPVRARRVLRWCGAFTVWTRIMLWVVSFSV